jgi:hypothetical protein
MDDFQSPSLTWQQDIKANDIVAFRFPHERESAEQPKVRPTLVLDVLTIGGVRYALLAFGTSSRRRRARALLVQVDCARELDTASLKAPTLFDGARRILVALSHSGFSLGRKYHTPVLGHLSGRSARDGDAVRRSVLQVSSARRSALFGRRSPR